MPRSKDPANLAQIGGEWLIATAVRPKIAADAPGRNA
jgi:hypothetical protein